MSVIVFHFIRLNLLQVVNEGVRRAATSHAMTADVGAPSESA
jgi:hypothetical protein